MKPICSIVLALTVFGTGTAQTIGADSLIGNYSGRAGGRSLELQLSARGSAVVRLDRTNYTGTWDLRSSNQITVGVRSSNDRLNFVFRPERNGSTLVSTSWDKDRFGRREIRLDRDGGSSPDPTPDREVVGDYYWVRPGADAEQLVTLGLDTRNRATLTIESGRTRIAPITSRGSWSWNRDDTIDVTVSGPNGRDRFTFRRRGSVLVATSWDRNEWGRTPPEFSKGRKPDLKPIDHAEGVWLYTRRVGRDDVRYTLGLMGNGRSYLLEERGRNRVESDGTWQWRGDDVYVRIRRSRDTLEFTFRLERDHLRAIRWDRDEFGNTRPDFHRR
jgi:hypothetical protein